MPSIEAEKQAARAIARQARQQAFETMAAGAPGLVARHFLDHFRLEQGAVVAAYLPIGTEVSPLPLIERLGLSGVVTALPVIIEPAAPLVFARWRLGDGLKPASHGTQQPLHDKDRVEANILLVPLLAFDGQGRRLGYGGGFYDRTIAGLREAGRPVLAIGLAFSAQEVEELPQDPYDQKLDGVVTELGVRHFDRTGLNI
ncbi:MAG: 5-formyltetrahydrofolate cyclo-ligase [Parvibaculaceae bacterium]|nr:5-formyltetrahydrofolate cyclo-ligase [Parvibaculaceae bacterium]